MTERHPSRHALVAFGAFAAPLSAIALLASHAHGQESAFVDLSGVSISSLSSNPPDVVRNSPTPISPASGYLFSINPIVRGTGFLGAIFIPSATPLGDVLNTFVPGSVGVLAGATRNPGGAIPVQVDREVVGGSFSGLDISLTLDLRILGNGTAQAGLLNITKPIGFGLSVVSGGASFQRFTPPPATSSEWHFDGNLLSVRQTGLAPESGAGKIRFLDDPAFGPILGGPGETTTLPNPPTPTGVTSLQSAFGTTSSFGISSINGVDAQVFRTSPPRNLADPTNRAKSRGLGLALFPATRQYWPDDHLGQWTIIWDLYIPSSSWNAGEFVVPLIEDNHNNDGEADMVIRNIGGVAHVNYQSPGNGTAVPAIGPDRWFRLALSSDGYRAKTGRLFVDGVFVGVTGGDWIYAATNPNDPRYADVSSSNTLGTSVPAGTWQAWGQFPSPWALSPTSPATPMSSTVCLFSDLLGRGQTVYIGSLFFTDEALPDAEIAALGGANARGIRYLSAPPCPADFNRDGFLDFFDYDDFIRCFEGESCPDGTSADFNNDGFADFFDFDEFVNAFESGC